MFVIPFHQIDRQATPEWLRAIPPLDQMPPGTKLRQGHLDGCDFLLMPADVGMLAFQAARPDVDMAVHEYDDLVAARSECAALEGHDRALVGTAPVVALVRGRLENIDDASEVFPENL